MTLYGVVELGGTKTDVAFGTTFEDLSEPVRVATTDPGETLGAVTQILASRKIDSVGVACFGPLHLEPRSPEFGTILKTPKSGWSGVPIHDSLVRALGVPVGIDTDVNSAVMGEGRWGATRGMTNYCYMTVGTGVGAGIVVAGRVMRGEHHPEMGHIAVERLEGDGHAGSCPYHGDCLEGMAAGPALEARFGRPETWAGNETVLELSAHYLTQGMLNLVYTVGPERIVVGGGVASLPGLHDRVRFRLEQRLAGYPTEMDPDLLISPPGLGDLSGLAGALILACERGR